MLIYSYARARAEAALCTKLEGVGFLERGERSIVLLTAYLLAALNLTSIASLLAQALAVAMCLALADRVVRLYLKLRRGRG